MRLIELILILQCFFKKNNAKSSKMKRKQSELDHLLFSVRMKSPSPFLQVVDGQRHSATAVQRRGDVDGIETLRLPYVLHRSQEVSQHLAGQHLLHVHVFDVELRLVGQRKLCAQRREEKAEGKRRKGGRGMEKTGGQPQCSSAD